MIDLHESLLEEPRDQYPKICLICHENVPNMSRVKQCNHDFCNDCLKLYFDYKITNGEVLRVLCPYSDCGTILEDSLIRNYTSENSYFKYKYYKKIRLLEKNINLRWCSKPGCDGYSIGSLRNRKLTCNKCESIFCYFCGNDWHDKQKCSNKYDKDFEKWAVNNNVKFCPGCKHRVYREGGCTEMKCASCQYTWCWNCGVSTKEHNDYQCMMGKSFFELYWTTIMVCIFIPFLLPFAVFFAILLKNEVFHINDSHKKVWIKVLEYFGLFIVSPLLLVCIVFGYCCLLISQLLLECTGRRVYALVVILGVLIGSVVATLVFAIAAILCVLLPPVGCLFLLIKFVYVLKRRCKYEKKWEYYPRTVV